MITENCPEYLAMRETKGFDCASINGKIYYIPFGCKSTAGTAQFFTVRNDILKTLGYEADEIKTVDQLLEVFEAVHQHFPECVLYPIPMLCIRCWATALQVS